MRNLTPHDLTVARADYERDGFAYLPKLMSDADLAPLASALDAGGASPGAFSVVDSAGGRQELSSWTDLANDLIGVIPRLEPIVAAAETMVGEPVYHWHSKLSWKRPKAESRWDWHQDYGFWAEEGVARPDMCTLAIAIAPVHEGNGCMRLIRGSHRWGRIDVVPVGPTRASDPAVVERVLDSHEVELCQLAAGDAVIFHGNTLHGSGPNMSEQIRTMLMCSYNAVSNPPSSAHAEGHDVSPLVPLPATALIDGWSNVFGESVFLDPDTIDYGTDAKKVH